MEGKHSKTKKLIAIFILLFIFAFSASYLIADSYSHYTDQVVIQGELLAEEDFGLNEEITEPATKADIDNSVEEEAIELEEHDSQESLNEEVEDSAEEIEQIEISENEDEMIEETESDSSQQEEGAG